MCFILVGSVLEPHSTINQLHVWVLGDKQSTPFLECYKIKKHCINEEIFT